MTLPTDISPYSTWTYRLRKMSYSRWGGRPHSTPTSHSMSNILTWRYQYGNQSSNRPHSISNYSTMKYWLIRAIPPFLVSMVRILLLLIFHRASSKTPWRHSTTWNCSGNSTSGIKSKTPWIPVSSTTTLAIQLSVDTEVISCSLAKTTSSNSRSRQTNSIFCRRARWIPLWMSASLSRDSWWGMSISSQKMSRWSPS